MTGPETERWESVRVDDAKRRPAIYRACLCVWALVLLSVNACNRSGNTDPGAVAQWSPGTTIPGQAPEGPRSPDPKFDYDSTAGCSDLIVYRTNKERSEVLVVLAEADSLGIKVGVNTFDLTTSRLDLSVAVRVYPRPQKHIQLCTDFLDPESDEPFIWLAVEGKLTVEQFPPDPKPGEMSKTYRVKVTLENAVFRGPPGRTAKCPHTITLDATVGWYPG